MDEQTLLSYFEKWYVKPYEKLKELPGGDGGFVAFMIGLAFYERLIRAKLTIGGLNPDDDNRFKKAMEDDLCLDSEQTKEFWEVFRNGLLHQGMPNFIADKKVLWKFREDYSDVPTWERSGEYRVMCINPWKFTQRVFDQFLSNPSLLDKSSRNPFGAAS